MWAQSFEELMNFWMEEGSTTDSQNLIDVIVTQMKGFHAGPFRAGFTLCRVLLKKLSLFFGIFEKEVFPSHWTGSTHS